MPVAEGHAPPSTPSRPQDGGELETSGEPESKERTKERGREGDRQRCLLNARDGYMEPHNTSTILATVKEQELQFERLTRELEAERLIVASQLERCKLQESETASMSSISSTDDSFHWRTSDGATGELSEDEGRVSVGSELVDSCLRALQERGLFEGPDPLHKGAVSSKLNSSPDSCYQETGSYQTSSHTGAQPLTQTLAGGGFQPASGAQATAAPEDSGARTMLTRSLSAQQQQSPQQQHVYTTQQQQQQRGHSDRAHAYTQLMRMYDLKTRGSAERDYETFAPKRSASLPPIREPPYGTVVATHGAGHGHAGVPRSARTLVHVPYGSPGPSGGSPAQRADLYVGKRAAAPTTGSGKYYWLSYGNTGAAAPVGVGSPNHTSPTSSSTSPLAGPAGAYARSSSQSPPPPLGYGNAVPVASGGGGAPPPPGSVMMHHHHHHHHHQPQQLAQQQQQQQQQLAQSSSPSSQASPAKRTPGGSDRQSPERMDRQRPGSLSGLRGSYSSQQGAGTEVRYVTSPDRLITPIYEDQVYRSPESATHSHARSPPDYALYSTVASSAVHRSSSQRSSRSGPGSRQRGSHSPSSHAEPGPAGLARRPSTESARGGRLVQPDGRLRRSTSTESLRGEQGELGWRDPDLLEVIQMLQHNLPSIQGNAAAYLQHLCYRDPNVKTEVRRLGGVPLLVDLLGHPKADVQKNACGSLKNLVYGNDENKKALRQAGGVPALATLLRRTSDPELQELATGLLWNLSSCEALKMAMVMDALNALVASVVVPCAGLSGDGELASAPLASAAQGIQSQVLKNATGCLRNMSSAGEEARRQMRECDGLVESLLHIIETCLDTEDVGGKVVENCVCVLRNLSYRLAAETLRGHDWGSGGVSAGGGAASGQDGGAAGPGGGGGGTGGRTGRARQKEKPSCWGKKRKKKPLDEWDGVGPIPECPDPPRGPERLFHPSVVNPYLGLLKKCANPATLEGAAGALQNLAAGGWKWSKYVRAMVRREKGLPVLVELLRMDSDRVVCAVATALRNMAMDVLSKELIGKYAMRDLVQRLPEPVTNNSIASSTAGGGGGGGGGMASGTGGDETPATTAAARGGGGGSGGGGNGSGHGETCSSEDTVAAVCCALNEVTTNNMENAKALRDAGGIERLVHVTRGRTDRVDSLPKDKSRMYASDTWTSSSGFSPKVVKAAAQVLNTLWQYRDLRALYKKDGWSQQHFLVLSTMERERNKPRAVSQPASPTRATAAIRSQSVGSALSTARDTSSFRESRRCEYEAVHSSSPSHRSSRPELPVRRDSSRGLPSQPCAGTYRSSYASQNVEDQSHSQTMMRATLAERQRRGDPSRRDYEAVYWTARPPLPGAGDSYFDERLHFAGDACGTHARHPPPGASANYVEFYSTRRAVAHATAPAAAAAAARGNYDSLHYRDATDSWV